jgi:uncharacterized repeat protein (TIGR04138 family)
MSDAVDLAGIAQRHGRYPLEAYAVVAEGLRFAMESSGKAQAKGDDRHLTAQELVQGVLGLTTARYGMLATRILARWNLHSSSDIGAVTYHLIEEGVLGKNQRDDRTDFDHGPAFAVEIETRNRSLLFAPRQGSSV